MKIKVLVKEKIAAPAIEKIKKKYVVDFEPEMSQEELATRIKDYDALIIRSGTQVTKEIIEKATNLKIIGRAGIGLDNVDVEAATRKGIIVANAPDSNIISAAEHALALLLASCRYIPAANSLLKSGVWDRKKFEGVELYGKTLGVLGLGKVGSLVAERALSFGMRVIAYDPYVSQDRASHLEVEVVSDLKELLREADIITLHLPKTSETLSMIGKKEFAMMKDGVRIINDARGGIIKEEDLLDAIKSGKVAGAALDVFEKEPCTSSPLFEFDEVLVTPHLGASTLEAQDKAGTVIAEQVIAALEGEFVSNAINVVAAKVEDAIKPFIPLSEKLGKLLTHLVEGRIDSLSVEYAGQVAEHDTSILTVVILKGLFSSVVQEPVTYVNVPLIAKDRGIEVKEIKTGKSKDFVNLIKLDAGDEKKPTSVAGTIVGKKQQERFVGIYDYDIDMSSSNYMAFIRYIDVPGMIGRVGTILGNNNINIASMQVGRKKIGGEAVMGLNIDSEISPDVLEEIKALEGITDAKFIVL